MLGGQERGVSLDYLVAADRETLYAVVRHDDSRRLPHVFRDDAITSTTMEMLHSNKLCSATWDIIVVLIRLRRLTSTISRLLV
jgi:hypothetical protein